MKKASRQYRRSQRETEKVDKAAPRRAKRRTIKRGEKQAAKREMRRAQRAEKRALNLGLADEIDQLVVQDMKPQLPVGLSKTLKFTTFPVRRFLGQNTAVTGGGYPVDPVIAFAWKAAAKAEWRLAS